MRKNNAGSSFDLELRIEALKEICEEIISVHGCEPIINIYTITGMVRLMDDDGIEYKLYKNKIPSIDGSKKFIVGMDNGNFVIASKSLGSSKIQRLVFSDSELPVVNNTIRNIIHNEYIRVCRYSDKLLTKAISNAYSDTVSK